MLSRASGLAKALKSATGAVDVGKKFLNCGVTFATSKLLKPALEVLFIAPLKAAEKPCSKISPTREMILDLDSRTAASRNGLEDSASKGCPIWFANPNTELDRKFSTL